MMIPGTEEYNVEATADGFPVVISHVRNVTNRNNCNFPFRYEFVTVLSVLSDKELLFSGHYRAPEAPPRRN